VGAGASLASSAFSQPTTPPYCAWSAEDLLKYGRHYSSSGNNSLDLAVIAELKKILKVLPINPGFNFIDDTSPNAFAIPASVIPGTQRTVYFGLKLLSSEIAEWGGVALAGLFAHECAHIFQFQNDYSEMLGGTTQQFVELHADYIAGFYFGKRRSVSKQHVEAFASSLFSKGDYDFNNPTHHGTPQERVAAMRRGYESGVSGIDLMIASRQVADLLKKENPSLGACSGEGNCGHVFSIQPITPWTPCAGRNCQ